MPQDTAVLSQFTPQTAAEAAKKSHFPGKRKPKPKRIDARTQAAELQSVLFRASKSLDCDMAKLEDAGERARVACAIASLAKGWDSIADRIRVMTGKPLPGSRRPPPDQPKKPKAQSAPRPAPIPAPTVAPE